MSVVVLDRNAPYQLTLPASKMLKTHGLKGANLQAWPLTLTDAGAQDCGN